jgi:hypothetical protein
MNPYKTDIAAAILEAALVLAFGVAFVIALAEAYK